MCSDEPYRDEQSSDKLSQRLLHLLINIYFILFVQIMVGSGDGVVRVLYDPDRSVNGARLCAVRTRAKVKQTDYVSNLAIIAPYSLPMFRQVTIIS